MRKFIGVTLMALTIAGIVPACNPAESGPIVKQVIKTGIPAGGVVIGGCTATKCGG